MIISNAVITFPTDPIYEGIRSSILVLGSSEDKIRDSTIRGGKIEAENIAWFYGCYIRTKTKVEVLGTHPPYPCSRVESCHIENTEMPKGYYGQCFFQELKEE